LTCPLAASWWGAGGAQVDVERPQRFGRN